MPFRSLFTSPPKKQYKGRKEAQERKCNRKKFDPNLLKQLSDRPNPFGLLKAEGRTPTFLKPPSLPYSKNFGSFDITWCVAKDRQRVVLVQYADRSFINGQQIILSPDGKVMDSRGQWDVKMQDYYDRALTIKENRDRQENLGEQMEKNISVSNELMSKDADEQNHIIQESSKKLLRSLTGTNRKPEKLHFDKQLSEFENLFGKIVTRCCNLGLESIVSEILDTVSCKEDALQMELADRPDIADSATIECDQKKVAIVLERMIDQFKSMVELSSVFQWQNGGIANEDECLSADVSITDSSWSITDDIKQLGLSRSILSLRQVSEKSFDGIKYQTQSLQQNHTLLVTSYDNLDDCYDNQKSDTRTICTQTTLGETFSIDKLSSNSRSSPTPTIESLQMENQYYNDGENQEQHCIQTKNQVLQNEILRLRAVNEELSVNVRRLTEDNLRFTGEVGKLRRENEDLNKCLRSSSDSKSQWNQNMRDLEREIVEMETKSTVTGKQNVLLSAQLEESNNECVCVKTKLRTMERETNDQLKYTTKLESEANRLRKENERLQMTTLELQSKLSSTMTENTHKLVELGSLRKDNNDRQIELLQLKTKLQKLEDANLACYEQKCILESELERIKLSHDAVTNEAEQLKTRTENLESANRSLLAEKTESQKRLEIIEQRCLENENELSEEKIKTTALTSEYDQLESSVRLLKGDNENLKTSVNELNEINEKLRSKLHKFEKGSTELECKFSRLVETKGDLQNVIRQLSHVNLNIEQRFKRMDSEYSDMECRLHNMDKLTTEYGHIDWGDQLGCNVTPTQEAISPRQ
ncbi:uncharacterized protein [Antedon mediterranea]|uniref:uncharacterized protein n=1 Tax=Antedon mediterranea TaxID=105859 RepID=UPI003AF7C17E